MGYLLWDMISNHILIILTYPNISYHIPTYPKISSGANSQMKDELTSAQAKKLGVEWPLWLEAVRKELCSLIIENEEFDVIEYEDVQI
jgi:hypothetical protein